ncbi:hypothetical protein CAPTEDRAFT_210277 [Capitella teleta]|uniref:Uncharacterized protein n=1 Tax=Capitella teleta TaxID=283909 RepID=N1PBC4_CAPTE|nr:hypothetical protein CAPTEDRAFT_210277 [Capitella teleta]|eukprot:ELU18809.1 hypothetical protein CAPTEDRAFT_210277 [Capitella teleta]
MASFKPMRETSKHFTDANIIYHTITIDAFCFKFSDTPIHYNHVQQTDPDKQRASNEAPTESKTWYNSMLASRHERTQFKPRLLEVRSSICVTGYHRESIQWVKSQLSQLMGDQAVALESFHIKHPSDLKDGSLLVPKVVMVASHCPGKKLIDEEGNEGQLDQLYDEVSDLGAEVMVIYTRIPSSVYPPFRHMVYHPKMVDILFPTQPLLREWAENNNFITVTENSELTNMQKNVLREWIRKPINRNHNVYKRVEVLTSAEWCYGQADDKPDKPAFNRSKSMPAKSKEPVEDRRKKKKKKKKRDEVPTMNLITLEEDDLELELYNAETKAGSAGQEGNQFV